MLLWQNLYTETNLCIYFFIDGNVYTSANIANDENIEIAGTSSSTFSDNASENNLNEICTVSIIT